MTQNKNSLTTTTGTGLALKNASKSLKITNKLLAKINNFEKHWNWWLSLDDISRLQLLANGLGMFEELPYVYDWDSDKWIISDITIDLDDKKLIKPLIQELLMLTDYSEGDPLVGFPRIERMLNLKEIMLWYGDIEYAQPIKHLINLESLIMDWVGIEDISFLSDSVSLKKVTLGGNSIKDVAVFRTLPNLKKLDLYENEIEDISELTYLTQLSTLNLTDNPIPKSEIKLLKKLLPNCKIKF